MESSISPAQQSRSRKNFLLVCLAFIVPIVLAKLALDQHWLDYGVTNKGQLVEGELTLSDLTIQSVHDEIVETQKPWLLIYHVPKQCDQFCLQLFNGLNNTYVAIGKDVKRVKLVAVTEQPFTASQLTHIKTERWTMVERPQFNRPEHLSPVFVADPLGNIVVSHPVPNTVEQLPAFGKSIVADFKTLLKLSRIG